MAPAAPAPAIDIRSLSSAEREMTVEAYLKAECKKRAGTVLLHMEGKIATFEREAKRARTELEAAARAAESRGEDDAEVGPEADESDAMGLVGIKGVYEGRTFEVPSAPNAKAKLVIGRSTTCDITLNSDDEVSSKHARIDVKNACFKLVDTNSTNGTFVNVQKLARNKPHTLKNGDKITLGASTFKWVRLADAEAAAAAAAEDEEA